MRITKARQKDLDDIVEINKAMQLDIPGFIWGTKAWTEEELKDYFVAREDDQVVGAMCLQVLPKEVYIVTMAVREGEQRTGVGVKLIEFAKSYTKTQGKPKLTVESFCRYKADKFYEKCGFTKLPDLLYCLGKPVRGFYMDVEKSTS